MITTIRSSWSVASNCLHLIGVRVRDKDSLLFFILPRGRSQVEFTFEVVIFDGR